MPHLVGDGFHVRRRTDGRKALQALVERIKGEDCANMEPPQGNIGASWQVISQYIRDCLELDPGDRGDRRKMANADAHFRSFERKVKLPALSKHPWSDALPIDEFASLWDSAWKELCEELPQRSAISKLRFELDLRMLRTDKYSVLPVTITEDSVSDFVLLKYKEQGPPHYYSYDTASSDSLPDNMQLSGEAYGPEAASGLRRAMERLVATLSDPEEETRGLLAGESLRPDSPGSDDTSSEGGTM
jgi:hypothetical protein